MTTQPTSESTHPPTQDQGQQGASAHAESAVPGRKARTSAKQPARPIDSFKAVIERGYARKGRPLILSRRDLATLASESRPSATDIEQLQALAAADRLMAVPAQILLTAMALRGQPAIRNAIVESLRELLLRYPLIVRHELGPVIRNLPDAMTLGGALLTLMRAVPSELSDGQGGTKKMRPGDFVALRSNAIATVLLWAVVTRGLTLDQVMNTLSSSLWAPGERGSADQLASLRGVVATLVNSDLRAACSLLVGRIEHVERQRSAAERSAVRVQQDLAATEADRTALTARVGELERDCAQLRAMVESHKESIAILELHHEDDLQRLRGRLVRRLSEEIELLDRGLQAIKARDPRINVMVDHAERVLDGLSAEIRHLDGGD